MHTDLGCWEGTNTEQNVTREYAISHGDVMYSMVTIVSSPALHISKLLGESILKVLITRKKIVTTYGDGC